MKKNILTLLCFLNTFYLMSQVPQIEWQNTIGGNRVDQLSAISKTLDGGYICGGWSWSDSINDKTEPHLFIDYWVIKLDANGQIEWQNTIGGDDEDRLSQIEQTKDGGYICGGTSWSFISGDKEEDCLGDLDYWVIKLDEYGQIEWQNTIGANGEDILTDIHQTFDGGYICAGYSEASASGDKSEPSLGAHDYWVVKIDSFGVIEWENSFGGSAQEVLNAIVQTEDSGYVCAGYSTSDASLDKSEDAIDGSSDYWLVKLNKSGDIVWDNTIGGTETDQLNCIVKTNDGGFICGGVSYSNVSGDKEEMAYGSGDIWILKLNALGQIEWQETIGGNDADWIHAIDEVEGGGYICGGNSESMISHDKEEDSYGGFDFWVFKLDLNGNILWQKTLGGSQNDELFDIQSLGGGAYICGGYSWSDISGVKTEDALGNRDYWVIKLEGDVLTNIKEENSNSFSKLFPNPMVDVGVIQLEPGNNTHITLEVFDMIGNKVQTFIQNGSEGKAVLQRENLKPGMYIYKMYNGKNLILSETFCVAW